MRIGYNTGYDPGGGAFVTEQERFMKEAVRQAKKGESLDGGSDRMRDRFRRKNHCEGI